MEKSEWLGRQAQLGFEPGTFPLPVLSVTAVPLVGRFLCLRVSVLDITKNSKQIIVESTNLVRNENKIGFFSFI